MFEYTDPTGTGALEKAGALPTYRQVLHSVYRQFGRRPRSAFTICEAFSELAPGTQQTTQKVTWLAFPRLTGAGASKDEIDRDRLRFQDEYVEWHTLRDAIGRVTRVTFTTEFPEYYEALAAQDPSALLQEVRTVVGSQAATIADLFGPNFNPVNATPSGRAAQLRAHLRSNPWNNGERSILCLTHRSSTLGALFGLVTECGVPKDIDPTDVCAAVNQACVPGRNSDPTVCAGAQTFARSQQGFTVADPAGVFIERIQGIWKRNGAQVDINDATKNGDVWHISRNGRRGVLTVSPDLTMGDDPITSGAQVAERLSVGTALWVAADAGLPSWARLGQESSRMLVD